MVSLGRLGAIPVPHCPVIFNGTNWGELTFLMEMYMSEQ